MTDKNTESVENYEFEPIKGYPMLNWKGKRPFRSTQYFPAQLKEVYGKEDNNGWINKIFWGDNLQVMSHLLKEFRGKVDLVYIDPPFDSNADYGKKVRLKKKSGITGDQNAFEEKQYTDLWSNDEYLQFMYERIVLLKELLSDTGLFYLHCDYHKSHHLRCILDEVFGQENFINECVWKRTTAHGDAKQGAKRYDIVHDNILVYSKTKKFTWNTQFIPFSDKQIAAQYNKVDEDGRNYRLVTPTASKPGGDTSYEFKGVTPYRSILGL
ncbi:site-specific DNA-methyltransferase [Pseudoalteromonas sp. Hal273]